jgi:hypothetical protein
LVDIPNLWTETVELEDTDGVRGGGAGNGGGGLTNDMAGCLERATKDYAMK